MADVLQKAESMNNGLESCFEIQLRGKAMVTLMN